MITATWKAVEQSRHVRELHLRAVGEMGRYMTTPPAKLDQMSVRTTPVSPSTVGPFDPSAG